MRTAIVPLSIAVITAACSSSIDRGASSTDDLVISTPTTPAWTSENNASDFFFHYKLDVPPAHTTTEAINTYDARAKELLRNEACDKLSEFRRSVNFPGEHWTKDALAMIAYDGDCPADTLRPASCMISGPTETQADRARCVNAALATFATPGVFLGSSFDPGDVPGYVRKGDLDMALKDLLPILFRFSNKLTPGTYAHLLDYFVQVDAGPSTNYFDEIDLTYEDFAWWAQALGYLGALPAKLDFDYASVPETENHRHMIYSLRYLANDLLYAAGRGDQFNNEKNGMKEYWLDRLASILRHDFQEYNSKPYNHLSLDAIQNLAELAHDPEVSTAARLVLDWAAAKYAVSSSLERRESPFRRRPEWDKNDFFGGATPSADGKWVNLGLMDDEACRSVLYAGTTDLFPFVNGAYEVPDACVFDARFALGTYRVPPSMVELALNKAQNPYFQVFAGGWNDIGGAPGNLEIYDNEGPFLIAGGGVANASGNDVVVHLHIGPPITIKNSHDSDRGIPVAAVVFPNRTYPTGDSRNFTDRAQAVTVQSGLCIAPGFACGLDVSFPPGSVYSGGADGRGWSFANYDTFYVAGYKAPVKVTGAGGNPVTTGVPLPVENRTIGFVEAVPSNRFASFEDFQNKVKAANTDVGGMVTLNGANDPATFGAGFDVHYTSALGGAVVAHFDPTQPRVYPVSQDRGLPLPAANTDTWPLASGIINAQHDGNVSIVTPSFKTSYSPAPTCQLLDADAGPNGVHGNPRRLGCDEMPPGYAPPPPPPTSSISWVHVTVPNNNTPYLFPPNAIVAGGVGSLDEYVCRVMTGTTPSMGHYDSRGACWTVLPNGSILGSADFDVMVFTPDGADDAFTWVYSEAGQTPANEYVAGKDANGGPIGVCRAETPTAHLYPGMLLNSGCVILDDNASTPTTFSTYSVMTLTKVSTAPPVGGCSPNTHCAGSCGQFPDGCGGMIDCGSCCPAWEHTDPSTGQCVQNTCDAEQCTADCRACNGSFGKCSTMGLCQCLSKKNCQ